MWHKRCILTAPNAKTHVSLCAGWAVASFPQLVHISPDACWLLGVLPNKEGAFRRSGRGGRPLTSPKLLFGMWLGWPAVSVSLSLFSASFLTWNSSLRLLPAWKGHGLNRGQQRAAVLAPSQLHREMCRCSNNACLLGGLEPMKPGPLQLHQASLKDGCWHAEGERLPAWWQCYTAIQGTGFCDLEESSKISIKSLPNVCSLSLCLFFSTLLWCWWVSYSGKSLGIEFTNGFL